MKSKARHLAYASILAALYAVLTHLQNIILPGSATWAIQLRLSEALNILCFFTPAAPMGLAIGCLIFKFPNALLISAFVGITNVIPFFGPFIGAIPSTLLILIEDPMKALWFVLFILGLQQLDGNVIGPKILGDRTGLSSFWVLFTIILFGGLWGVVGMVIGVPLFAVIYDTVKRLVRLGLFRKGQLEVWEQYKADYPDEDSSNR